MVATGVAIASVFWEVTIIVVAGIVIAITAVIVWLGLRGLAAMTTPVTVPGGDIQNLTSINTIGVA
jgi:hypothetical protein